MTKITNSLTINIEIMNKKTVSLLYPILGSFLYLFVIYLEESKNSQHIPSDSDDLFFIVYILLFIPCSYPLWRINKPLFSKILLIILYYIVSIIIAFYIIYLGLISISGYHN
ncbi:hypothetical protein FLB_00110 [Flavobacterium succinicans]|uniref:Uncharacterized protein n=1 Tax=Flavobacterium succinicans TaxID=29536 RepID=A0A199XW43_9FLAO|nr:hypothetical protein FLB_00110 [Flavobacterium succinicans]